MEDKLKFTDKINTSLSYQGYLWLSDRKEPIVFDGDSAMNQHEKFNEINLPSNDNPFIIEGFLFENNKSYSIKYVDGKYLINEYTVTEDEKRNSKKYLAHRMPTVEKLKFIQRWELVRDRYCNGMEVLQPAELVFIGFIFKNKEELL